MQPNESISPQPDLSPDGALRPAPHSNGNHPHAPILLFDGACNLCNGAVTWIIEHDTKGLFKFASLQSQAAKDAVSATKSPSVMADSVVLIDNDKIYTRMDAAIGIARRLGLPWSLLSIAGILPKGIRDGLYDFVARNRYRWFGQRTLCLVPTPDLRERFLDRDEVPAQVAPTIALDGTPADARGMPNSLTTLRVLAAWIQRTLFIYIFLNIFPFPLNVIPGLTSLSDAFTSAKQYLVTLFSEKFIGYSITIYPQGSGDTTYNYMELLFYLLLALLLAGFWNYARRGWPISIYIKDRFQIYIRYYLASTLLSYGIIKLFALQMPYPQADRLIEPIGDLSPMGMAWTFIGASPMYQIFAGASECVAGLLLFWRRTTLLGSLLAVGVLLNVVILNLSYDIPVKIFSSHLLFFTLILILPHLARLSAVIFFNLPAQPSILRPVRSRPGPARLAASIIKVLFIFNTIFMGVYLAYTQYQETHIQKSQRNLAGLYHVSDFTFDGVSGRDLPDDLRWVLVGISDTGSMAAKTASGRYTRFRYSISPDSKTLSLSLRDTDPANTPSFSLSEPTPGTLILSGTINQRPASLTLTLDPTFKPLLTSRGFHWINEFPLNR